jgi:hypothetical protein
LTATVAMRGKVQRAHLMERRLDRARQAPRRRLKTSLSQGVEWKALISTYIGIMPPRTVALCPARQSMSAWLSPKMLVTSATTAKVGAAARDS